MTGKKRTKETCNMRYRIEFSGFSVKGPFRRRNEDNLLCGGVFLPAAHGDSKQIEGSRKVCRKPAAQATDAIYWDRRIRLPDHHVRLSQKLDILRSNLKRWGTLDNVTMLLARVNKIG